MRHTILTIILACSLSGLWAQTPLTEAQNIKITDINGNFHSLMTYLNNGQYVLLDFLSATCGPCQGVASKLDTVYKHFKNNQESLVILGIDKSFDDEMVTNFANANHASFPIASGLDGGGGLAFEIYQVPYYPCLVLIAPDKKILSASLPHEGNAQSIIDSLHAYGISNVGIEEAYADEYKLQLFPNPATHTLQLTQQGNADDNHRFQSLSIYNITGQKLSTQNIEHNPLPLQIDVAKLRKGMYYIRLTQADGRIASLAFVKQ